VKVKDAQVDVLRKELLDDLVVIVVDGEPFGLKLGHR
jgi:hypothetical protein